MCACQWERNGISITSTLWFLLRIETTGLFTVCSVHSQAIMLLHRWWGGEGHVLWLSGWMSALEYMGAALQSGQSHEEQADDNKGSFLVPDFLTSHRVPLFLCHLPELQGGEGWRDTVRCQGQGYQGRTLWRQEPGKRPPDAGH